jgi:hypothetical protein
VDYLRDGTVSLNEGRRTSTARAVQGKSYELDVGPGDALALPDNPLDPLS